MAGRRNIAVLRAMMGPKRVAKTQARAHELQNKRSGKGIVAMVSLEDLEPLEKIEDEIDASEARKILVDMKRKGERAIPLPQLKNRIGLK